MLVFEVAGVVAWMAVVWMAVAWTAVAWMAAGGICDTWGGLKVMLSTVWSVVVGFFDVMMVWKRTVRVGEVKCFFVCLPGVRWYSVA